MTEVFWGKESIDRPRVLREKDWSEGGDGDGDRRKLGPCPRGFTS